ncbi:MAG: trypsin-like serine protease [Proteobacteria bacterium]|nr:MAG: trypsin-like serine protease [Pseudomonadota bacterium]
MKHFLLSLLPILALNACGQITPYPSSGLEQAASSIRGGVPVEPSDAVFRSTVAISRNENEHCTGSLIAPNLVVTAAHCLDQRHRRDFPFQKGFAVTFSETESREVLDWRIHPDWLSRPAQAVRAPKAGDGDLAIVRFAGDIPAGFKPAMRLGADRELKIGEEVILAGFGSQDNPGRDDTQRILRRAEVKVLRLPAGRYEVHLDQRAGKGACGGDSGGPAFLLVGGEPLLWGVTNHAIDWQDGVDYMCQRTTVYADIRRAEPWFSTSVAELERAL